MKNTNLLNLLIILLNILIFNIYLHFKYNVITNVFASYISSKNNKFTFLWEKSINKDINNCFLKPVTNDILIFIANIKGKVIALNKDNGKIVWLTNILDNKKASKLSGMTATKDRLYIGSELSKLYSLDASNGNIIWQTNVVSEILSTPVVDNNLVIVHTNNGMLQAINCDNGHIKWTVNVSTSVLLTLIGQSSPKIASNIVVVGGDDGYITALDIKYGKILWKKYIAKENNLNINLNIKTIKSSPVIVNNVVYAIACNGNFMALDLNSGNVIWCNKIGSIIDFVITDNFIYLIDQNHCIIKLDTKKGNIIWCQKLLINYILNSLITYKNYVIVFDFEGNLHLLSLINGTYLYKYNLDNSGILNAPLVIKDKIIIQTKNNKIYALSI